MVVADVTGTPTILMPSHIPTSMCAFAWVKSWRPTAANSGGASHLPLAPVLSPLRPRSRSLGGIVTLRDERAYRVACRLLPLGAQCSEQPT